MSQITKYSTKWQKKLSEIWPPDKSFTDNSLTAIWEYLTDKGKKIKSKTSNWWRKPNKCGIGLKQRLHAGRKCSEQKKKGSRRHSALKLHCKKHSY